MKNGGTDPQNSSILRSASLEGHTLETTVTTVKQETLVRSCQVIVRGNENAFAIFSAFNASQFHHLPYI